MRSKYRWWLVLLGACLSLVARAQPAIEFTQVPPFGSSADLYGRVTGVAPTDFNVAVYIFISGGGWWTKPNSASPLTAIQTNGTWQCDITTGGIDQCARQIAAFLVPTNYTPPLAAGDEGLPAGLATNAVANLTVTRPFPRQLHFSGYDWEVKTSCGGRAGPGPNYFSDSVSNVWVDVQGQLHLRITNTNDQWQCVEMISRRSFGHGTYRSYLDSPADLLDLNAVLGLFTWSEDPSYSHREIDVEVSRWSDASDTNNTQFVVQPWDTAGHRVRFQVPSGLTNSTHSFTWATNQVFFQSHQGNLVSPPATNPVISQWTFNQSGVPVPGGENVHLNLWLYNGAAPTNGQPVEVIVSRFVFVPSPLVAPTVTAVQIPTNRQFQLHAIGEPQLSYILQTSSNLTDWTSASTNLTVEGPLDLVDTNASSFLHRFYRLLVPPQ